MSKISESSMEKPFKKLLPNTPNYVTQLNWPVSKRKVLVMEFS